jgi:bifunctional NMN adenylyltransferase/nudix hydrolase
MDNKPKATFGAIVGRYQTPYLHEGHKSIINKIVEKHENLIVFLGVFDGQPNDDNPMDFATRRVMILESYPEAIVLPLPDKKSDEVWSSLLDEKIKEVIGRNSCILYGGRDSFIPYYTTKTYEVNELESPNVLISATTIREEVIRKARNSVDFRTGVIYGVTKRFKSPYTAVDIAPVREGKVLMVRKPDEKGLRFAGGHVDNSDESFEAAALREFKEEVGRNMVVSTPVYVKSFRINDWRYKKTKEKIFSSLYVVECLSGTPDPDDDVNYAEWVPFEDLYRTNIEPEHQPLVDALIDFIEKNYKKQS